MMAKSGKKTKKLRAVRKGERWQIKLGGELLYIAFLDRAQRVLHVFPIPDTLAALESCRRYHTNLLSGRWQGKDPDGIAGEIKDADRLAQLETIRALCLPFPNIGDHVTWAHPVSGVLRGTVLEVAKNKQGEWKAWFETADRKRYSVPRGELSRPKNEAKAASV